MCASKIFHVGVWWWFESVLLWTCRPWRCWDIWNGAQWISARVWYVNHLFVLNCATFFKLNICLGCSVFVFSHFMFMLLCHCIELVDALHLLLLSVDCWPGCPYACLSDGPISQRLSSVENRLQLLLYLVTELQALRMTAICKPQLLVGLSSKQQKAVSFSF